jgi:predicted nucleotide-binding protein
MNALAEKIEELIRIGFKPTTESDYHVWRKRVSAFLTQAIDASVASDFYKIVGEQWRDRRASQIGMLEGLVQKILQESATSVSGSVSPPQVAQETLLSKKVFVVHGHHKEAKETVARFIDGLGLESIILHERPNEGRTLIEKFEVHADVGFAVVLLTPDDVGAPATEPTKLNKRARQNVILELGYFAGKLGRSRVCALYKAGVEIPSDFQGVVYIELDPHDAWRMKLAQELTAAHMPINLEALFKT